MFERIKELRKALGLTQKEFGGRLGISRDVEANIENDRVEPSKSLIKLICATYNVDYIWLTTGQGTMFHESLDSLADKVNDLLEGENETARAVFSAFAEFSEQDWQTVQKFMDGLKGQQKNGAD